MIQSRVQSGFTLVEILAVLILIGIIAGATVMTLKDRHSSVTLTGLLDRIEYWDQRTRDAAKNLKLPHALYFDLNKQTIQRASRVPQDTSGPVLQFPHHIRFTRLLTLPDNYEPVDQKVHVSAKGYSPSYVIKIEHNRRTGWLLIVGLTGHAQWIENEQTLQNILHGLQVARTHTD